MFGEEFGRVRVPVHNLGGLSKGSGCYSEWDVKDDRSRLRLSKDHVGCWAVFWLEGARHYLSSVHVVRLLTNRIQPGAQSATPTLESYSWPLESP